MGYNYEDKWSYALFIPCLYPSLYEYDDTRHIQTFNVVHKDVQLNTICDHIVRHYNQTSPKPKFIAPRFEKKWLESHQNPHYVRRQYNTSQPIAIKQSKPQIMSSNSLSNSVSSHSSTSTSSSSGYGSIIDQSPPSIKNKKKSKNYNHNNKNRNVKTRA